MALCTIKLGVPWEYTAFRMGEIICSPMREEGSQGGTVTLSHSFFLEHLLGWCRYMQPNTRLSLKA